MLGDRLLWKIFSFMSLVVFAMVFAKLFYLQVVQHDFYDKLVDTQSTARITFTKDRGLIFDRNGSPLAQNHKKASLYTFARNIEDVDQFVRQLRAGGITVNKNVVNNLKNKENFVWIVRHINIEKAVAIKKAVPGVQYCLEDARFYPEGEMLAGVIGYTGVDNQGLSGVEYFADKTLAGKVIPVNVIRDSRGKLILFDDSALKTKPDSAVYLTIDAQIQGVADRILRVDMAEFKAKKAVVLAMDVATGEIIVASAISADKSDSNKNFATTYLFEPGSIFKAVSFGYLIEKGLYRPDEAVNTSKFVTLYGHNIKDVYMYKSLTQREVFTKSSNIGTVMLTSKIGNEAYYNHLIRCGFGRKSGIDAASEEAGVLREAKNWSGLSLASLSIGQEILVSPVQVVRYYGAIANKGVAMKPAIIHHYEEAGKVLTPKKESEQMISGATAATLLSMLADTVEGGTGKRARTKMLAIGGKTGTAQMVDQKTKTYSKTDYVASFAGVFPVENPRIAMVVIYENPRSSIYGGETGAVTFRKIAEQIAFYYDIGGENTRVHYVAK